MLSSALGPGGPFDLERWNLKSEDYLNPLPPNAIDRYIQLRAIDDAGEPANKIDSRLSTIIESRFKNYLDERQRKQVRDRSSLAILSYEALQ